jgi:hypothetical protein
VDTHLFEQILISVKKIIPYLNLAFFGLSRKVSPCQELVPEHAQKSRRISDDWPVSGRGEL